MRKVTCRYCGKSYWVGDDEDDKCPYCKKSQDDEAKTSLADYM